MKYAIAIIVLVFGLLMCSAANATEKRDVIIRSEIVES